MTLILTLGNASGVYQSSDYQLTDPTTGSPVSDRNGDKQLQATFEGIDVRLAFTGIAAVKVGSSWIRTIEWLSDELKALPHNSRLQDICAALASRSAAKLSNYRVRGVLELILTVATVGQPFRVAVISNVDWRERPPEAKRQFKIRIDTITKPFLLISGRLKSVAPGQRQRLRALARAVDRPPDQILKALADINAIAAKDSNGYVSQDCWVTSQTVDGRVRRSASLNIGQHEGAIHQLVGGFDVSEFIKKNFRAAPGKEIKLIQGAGAMAGPGDAIPLPPPSGEPRRFKLSGSTVVGLLRSPTGDHCASVEIALLEGVPEMRCNEEVTGPFATVTLTGVRPICKAFAKPLLPWPQLNPALLIDDIAVPRGWEHSVCHWIEDETHHVIIPASSRSIRNLAFLGPDDEIVIVAPSTTLEFTWGDHEIGPSTTMQARIWWRSRVDGTRG
jgi:hypothetical protein